MEAIFITEAQMFNIRITYPMVVLAGTAIKIMQIFLYKTDQLLQVTVLFIE